MCGIAGIYYFNNSDDTDHSNNDLKVLLKNISHRGPDDQGVAVYGNCAIGMVRLSIIDIPAGHQPMLSSDKRYSIVFNGEIYNFQSIRGELIKKSIDFDTNSDTEVILKGYIEYGKDILDMLEGMFAFCIYDSKKHELFIARDRLGKKPLYYYKDEEKLIFCSEVQAIKQLNKLYKSYASRVSKAHDVNAFSTILKQFYGRVSSVMKQIKDNLAYLEQSRKIMKTYPDIKEMFTVCFYGFPNVGKTTLLNKFTGTKAKIAGYEFTTKSINAGYTIIDRKKIQVLDVPGTLARKETMNNIELMAELVLDEVADVVIYVFDFSGTGRMGEAKQRALFEKIKDKHKVIPYLAKTDLTPREKWSGFVKSKQELKKLIKSHL